MKLVTALIVVTVTQPSAAGHVQAGACIENNQLVQCALQARDCNDPQGFVSSRLLHLSPENSDGRDCLGDATQALRQTLYGACQDLQTMDTVCRWDQTDCNTEQAQVWIPAANVRGLSGGEDCTCDKVKTGACVATGERQTYCAVSADACDDESAFSPASSLEDGINCNLCAASSNNNVPTVADTLFTTPAPAPSNIGLPPSPNPTVTNRAPFSRRPTFMPTDARTTSEQANDKAKKDAQPLTSMVVGRVIGVVAALLLVVFVGGYCVLRHRSRGSDSTVAAAPAKKATGDENVNAFELQAESDRSMV